VADLEVHRCLDEAVGNVVGRVQHAQLGGAAHREGPQKGGYWRLAMKGPASNSPRREAERPAPDNKVQPSASRGLA
jgi:hypothetical protein